MLRRNWKHQWLPLYLARHERRARMERPVARLVISSRNLRVSWKSVNPQDCVRKNLYQITMRTMLQEEGDNSPQHYNLVHKFIPVSQAMKIPAANAAVDKEWEKLEKISTRNLTTVRSKRGDRWRKDVGRKSSFCIINGHITFEKCWIGGKAPKIQRSSCTSRWYCERRFRVLCRIHWTRIMSITNDSGKSHGYHFQTIRLRRTSSWRSICLFPGKNGRCSKITENSQIGMSRHWIRPPRHKWPKSWSSMENPVVPLERNLYCHPLAGLLWERQFEKILLQHGWEKVSKLGMSLRTPWKRTILTCVCGWHQIHWKETKHWSDVESTQQRSWFGRTNIFPRSCIPGVHSKTMPNKQRYCWQLQNHVRIANFRGSNGKITMLGKSKYLFVVLWQEGHAKKCVERKCELTSKTTQQLYKVSSPCIDDHHFKEEETKSVGELSNTCSQIVLKCLYLARIGRPDILWSVNKLARSITKWTKACDKRLNRFWYLTFITHVNINSIVMWVILAYMCVKLQMRLYVCHRVGPFWVHFGSILGPFWVHFGSILGPFWVHFGSILGPFWVHFGSILGSFLGPFWVHFGSILGPFWVHFGDASLGFTISI